MKTLHTALATLVVLGTACDLETPATRSDASSFRGEVFIPPTTTTGTVLIGKGGHDLPTEVLQRGFDESPYEIQISFLSEIEVATRKAFIEQFLANERAYEECPWQCEEHGLGWDEGVNVLEMRVEHAGVSLVSDKGGTGLHWETEVRAEAQVGCGCLAP